MDLTEDDFEWSQRPVILCLGPELADRCHQYLRPKRKPRSVGELYSMFMIECSTTLPAARVTAPPYTFARM
jgi:hypothetical protein